MYVAYLASIEALKMEDLGRGAVMSKQMENG
jgi:hypothetical protein